MNNLSQSISKCSQCELRTSCTQVVIGSGSKNAKILFIGEAPGKKEDKLGLPFVGFSGKQFDLMLDSIQINRKEVYITNIVKCRPPKNRDPEDKEISLCTPWLIQQIKLIDPKLIVTLGRHSMNFFLPGLHISSSHGQIHTLKIDALKKSFTLLTLYHPMIARFGGLRDVLFSDFAKIPKILKKMQ